MVEVVYFIPYTKEEKMMQRRKVAAKSVAVALAFSMAFSMSAGIKADAAKKKAPKLDPSSLTLEKGQTSKIKVVKNKNKISKVTWTSTKPKVASVTTKGVVKAKAVGKATIKAAFKVNKKKTTLKCKVTVTNTPSLAGGWEVPESPVVSAELAALVKQFYDATAKDGLYPMTVTPYALLGTQVVNGTGYRVLCRADFKDQSGKSVSSYSIVQIYADLSGALVVDASKVIAYMDDFASELVAVSGSSVGIVGGFTQFDDPTIPAENLEAYKKFFTDNNISFPYKPVARLSHRESTGKREVAIVCTHELTSSGNVNTNENIGYFILKMDIDSTTEKHVKVSSLIWPISFIETEYSVCVEGIPAVDVETQAAWIRSYIIDAFAGDSAAIENLAQKISYPVTVDGNPMSKEEFLATLVTRKISPDFAIALGKDVTMQMSASYQGINLGDGDHNIWLNQDQTDKTKLVITSINGIFAK